MYIGQAITRVDGRAKVTGGAIYAAEFPIRGVVHAVLVQSTIPAGEIERVDTDAARAMPGVLAIITPADADRLNTKKSAMQTVTAPLLQDGKIYFNGQHVAVAVAETLEQATAAAEAVRVRYRQDETPPVAAMERALDHAYMPKNFRDGMEKPDTREGDPDAAFAAASVRLEATYITPMENHNPMEPHATIARWDGDRLTVWTATQGITGANETLASMFGVPKEDVIVICPYVGGGFGCKGNTWPPATLAAMAARTVGRPVKLMVTRRQMFTSNGYRPTTVQALRVGASRDGTLTAIRHDSITQMSMPALGEYSEGAGLATRMLYACPNVATTHRLVATNHSLPTYMRAPGEAPGIFALESAMDELAVALKMDPVALRLKNYADADPGKHLPFASKALKQCYAQAAEAFGWEKRSAEPRSMRDGRVLVGWGMATSTYPTNRSPASARVRLMRDGTATVQSGTQDLGTGTYTIMAQTTADALGLPMASVRAELGDSRYPPAPVSGGSMSAASVLPAVQAAAEQVRAELVTLLVANGGNAWRDADPLQIRVAGAAVEGPPGRVTLAELFARRGSDHIEARVDAKPGEESAKFSRHAFGAQFCEVRVDPDLGTIRVSRWVGAFDCGRVLNAKTARSQLIGGIVFGIGMALLEETRVDPNTARIMNANIAEYQMPVNADIPDITTIMLNAPDTATDPLGAKGIGELPMVGTAPAVANAVYHATGVRVRRLPIRIEDVLG